MIEKVIARSVRENGDNPFSLVVIDGEERKFEELGRDFQFCHEESIDHLDPAIIKREDQVAARYREMLNQPVTWGQRGRKSSR